MNVKPIRAIYWDAVGTILEPIPGVAEQYALVAAEFGQDVPLPEVKRRLADAHKLQETIDVANRWQTSEEREYQRWSTVVHTVFADHPQVSEVFERLHAWYALPQAWQIYADAEQILDWLKETGYRFGLASNFDSRLQRIVESNPDLQFFRTRLWISSVMGVRKPGSEFFRKIISAEQLPAAEILYVGDDWTNDYLGAQAAGMQTLLIDRDNKYPECPKRVQSLAEIPRYLATSAAV